MLPTIDFFGKQITRLILGDNPVNGHSYIQDYISGEEMKKFYTPQKILELLFAAEEAGYNTILPLANPNMFSVLHEYRNAGGKLNLIFQPYPAQPLDINMEEMMALDPVAIYHQGTTTDYLTETGNYETLLSNIEKIRKGGIPVGLGTHVPETVLQSEKENWGIDFYMTCLYNARRTQRGEQSGFITGITKAGLLFYPEDRFLMLDVVKKVNKPFIVYKILAGGQVFNQKPAAEYPKVLEYYIRETYENIKPGDIACMGVFQRDSDQLRQNADITYKILK